tara:strand:+ start:55435 stop:56175 length:741 start_codon:yes stop_codon:yes gene_type:complete
LPLSHHAASQEVSRLEIHKDMPHIGASGRTAVEIYLAMDLAGFNLENPIDPALTRLETFADDRGTDLLARHKVRKRENEERGFPAPDPVAFAGVGDWTNDRDIKLAISVVDTPSAGATKLRLAGEVVLNFAAEGEAGTALVEDIPMPGGRADSGFASPLGELQIKGGGSASRDDVTWHKFLVSSDSSAIVGVSVVGGDDADEVSFWSLEPNAFVFREPPATVALQLRYHGQKKVHVPLDMSISLGL